MRAFRRLRWTGVVLFGLITAVASLAAARTSSSADGSASPFQIANPGDKTFLSGQFITVVVRVSDKTMDTISVEVNGKRRSLPPTRESLCFGGCELAPGLNTITVTAEKGGATLHKAELTVYRVVEVSREFPVPPQEFVSNPFHAEKKEAACLPCHRMEPGERDLGPSAPSDSLCYTCHKQITGFQNVHGPAAVWGCLTCHESEGTPLRYRVKNPTRDVCFTCHSDMEAQWAQKGFVHGPTATGACTICHSPHASDNIFWLKKPVWDLCISCHDEKAAETHVVAGFVYGSSHPTKGRPDPLRKGREFSCASCHNPHTSNSRLLFINDSDGSVGLCQMCHQK